MNQTTIRARSLPYREPRPKTYTCKRCGIQPERNGGRRPTYCVDCLPEARALGWTPRYERKAA